MTLRNLLRKLYVKLTAKKVFTRKVVSNMLHYRIEIQGDTNGALWYDVAFHSEKNSSEANKINTADVAYIHSTVDKFADALKALPTSKT